MAAKHHRIQKSDTFEIATILQTTTLARLRATDLKILTNVVKYLTLFCMSSRQENLVKWNEHGFIALLYARCVKK
jgi:hypothetical protein